MAKNKEANKWRNLILIVVVIVVIALAVIYGPGLISDGGQPQGTTSLDAAFLAMADLSESKGVDYTNLIEGSLVEIDMDSGEIAYPRNDLLDFNDDLEDFVEGYEGRLSSADYTRLILVSALVSNKIALYDSYYETLLSLEDLDEYWICYDVEYALYIVMENIDVTLEKYDIFQSANVESGGIVSSGFEKHIDYLDNASENISSALESCEEAGFFE
jgi:hypothetical protein